MAKQNKCSNITNIPFDMLSFSTKTIDVLPPVNETLRFWKELWERPCQHDVSILSHITADMNCKPIEPMETPVITEELVFVCYN